MALIPGTSANDTIYGNEEDDQIYGYAGDDFLAGKKGNDAIFGGSGNDTLEGGAGSDTLHGGDGEDILWGGHGNDKLYGDKNDDLLLGDNGNDTLDGSNGNDSLTDGFRASTGGIADNDLFIGGAGNDYFNTIWGQDTLQGGDGNDSFLCINSDAFTYLYGGNGADEFLTSHHASGRGFLFGEAGNDRFNISSAGDIVSGGAGDDRFTFFTYTPDKVNAAHTQIVDFDANREKIDLSYMQGIQWKSLTFQQLGNGTLISFNHQDMFASSPVHYEIMLDGIAKIQLSATDFIFG